MNESVQEAVDLLKKMIAIPSVSRDECKVAELLYTYMTGKGLMVNRDGHNVWSVAPGYHASKPTLLLNAHIDTVKPAAAWIRNPFEATEEEGRLYGLGSNDDGASVVSLLQAFLQLREKPQSYNLIFLASSEEEVSGKEGIERVLPKLPPVSVALVGEPTGMHPAIAEKGLMVLDLVAHGKSGHAARNEGDNAIYKAVDDINWIRNYTFPKVSELLGAVKMTTTIIQAGTQHNVIPDTCTFTVDVRSNELYSNEEIFETVRANVKSEVSARSFRLSSSRIAESHPLVARAMELGRVPFGSPTLSDQALMRFPSFKMGPGQSSRSHTADEYIEIAEIAEAIVLYVEMLDGLNLGE